MGPNENRFLHSKQAPVFCPSGHSATRLQTHCLRWDSFLENLRIACGANAPQRKGNTHKPTMQANAARTLKNTLGPSTYRGRP